MSDQESSSSGAEAVVCHRTVLLVRLNILYTLNITCELWKNIGAWQKHTRFKLLLLLHQFSFSVCVCCCFQWYIALFIEESKKKKHANAWCVKSICVVDVCSAYIYHNDKLLGFGKVQWADTVLLFCVNVHLMTATETERTTNENDE